MDFFWPAPDEIGPVVSAYSTLDEGQPHPRLSKWFGVWLCITLGGAAIGAVNGYLMWGSDLSPQDVYQGVRYGFYIGVVSGFLMGWLVAPGMGFHHCCSYIGEEGAAYAEVWDKRLNPVSSQSFVFESAMVLYVNVVCVSDEGDNRYEFDYIWKDDDGKVVFSISGVGITRRDGLLKQEEIASIGLDPEGFLIVKKDVGWFGR